MASDKQDSPPPVPPTAYAPGIRANALQQNFEQAFSHTLKVCSYSNFAACFPTPAEHVPEALRGLHREFVSKLERVCKTEFKTLMEDRDVIQGLNELDGLIGVARKRMEKHRDEDIDGPAIESPPPPHLMQPSALLQARLSRFMKPQISELEVKHEEVQRSNSAIIEEILVQRSTIDTFLSSLESLVIDLEGAAEAFSSVETSRVETEMEDVR